MLIIHPIKLIHAWNESYIKLFNHFSNWFRKLVSFLSYNFRKLTLDHPLSVFRSPKALKYTCKNQVNISNIHSQQLKKELALHNSTKADYSCQFEEIFCKEHFPNLKQITHRKHMC